VVKSTPLPSFPLAAKANSNGSQGSKSTVGDDSLVEGWRAVLGVVGRAGMGARRRRSDIFGPTNSTDEGREEGEGADVDEMVESVKRGGSKELLRYVKGLLG